MFFFSLSIFRPIDSYWSKKTPPKTTEYNNTIEKIINNKNSIYIFNINTNTINKIEKKNNLKHFIFAFVLF